MQKQVFYKRVHAGKRANSYIHHRTVSRCWEERRQTHHNATCRAFLFPLDYDRMVRFGLLAERKGRLFDKQKKVRVQSAGPAQGEATLRKGELSNMNEKEQR